MSGNEDKADAPPPSLGLPADALKVVLSFSDLAGVASTSATSTELRDGMRALCPALQHELIRTVFPILSTLEWGAGARPPPPRELYLSQTRLVDELQGHPIPIVEPTVGLDAYIFSLEIFEGVLLRAGGELRKAWKSVYVGTSWDVTGPLIEWTIPADLFMTACKTHLDHDLITTRVRIMATRRGTFERALLYQGDVEEFDEEDGLVSLYFQEKIVPCGRENAGTVNLAVGYDTDTCPRLNLGWHQVSKDVIIKDKDNIPRKNIGFLRATFSIPWRGDPAEVASVNEVLFILEQWAAFSA